MPMSPRLLRPIASRSLVDADATAYLSAVQTADGQALEPAVRNAITAFVVGCKQDGVWSAIKASCLLMGARTLSGALTPLVGTAPTNNNFVAGDYNRKTGLLGNGSTKYLDSNRNNNADPQNSNHNAAYVSFVGTGVVIGSQAQAGVNGSNSLSHAASRSRNTSFASRDLTQSGFCGTSRSNAGSYQVRVNASAFTEAISSQAPDNTNIGVLAFGNAAAYGTHRVSFYSIGESLTLSLLDTRVSALYTAIGAAIP